MEMVDTEALIKQPIILGGIDLASRVAVCIDLLAYTNDRKEKKIGSGTGFFHRRQGTDYLITNWHVLTGRNPEAPSNLLPGFPESPSAIRLYLPLKGAPNQFVPSEAFSLYEPNGAPSWLEMRSTPYRLDLGAMPFDLSDELFVVRVEQLSEPHNDKLRAGRRVVIVGYPFGIRPESPFPIWKQGFLASEPSILIGGKPQYYIDTPGRPGMSGSPVFTISSALRVSKKTQELISEASTSSEPLKFLEQFDTQELLDAPQVNSLQFAGVYSGALGDQRLLQMSLGIAWHGAMIDSLFTNPRKGDNPFPPTAF